MRVLCIKDIKPEDKSYIEKGRPSPHFAEECEVLQSKDHCGAIYYQLGGRFHRRSGFRADYFAILPDQSADEMSEESKEAIANLEHKPV